MNSKAQKLQPEIEDQIRMAIKNSKEAAKQLQLGIQSLTALLPSTNTSKSKSDIFTDPETGKEYVLDKKLNKYVPVKIKNNFKLLSGGKNGK